MTATALVLNFEKHRLHALTRGDLIWFILADVCNALGIDDPSMVAARLDEDQKGTTIVGRSGGGPQRMLIVSEDGVYDLATKSRKPIAKRFKRWLYREVLPAIRRTGSYQGGSTPLDALIGTLQPEFDLAPANTNNDDADDTNARHLWTQSETSQDDLPMFKRHEWAWIEKEGDAICMFTQRNYPQGGAMMLRAVSDVAPTPTRLRVFEPPTSLHVLEPNGKQLLICVDHAVPLALVERAYARLGRGPMSDITLNTLREYLVR